METIKTAIVVVLLLAVLYGVYAVLSKPQLEPPPEVTWGDGAIEAPQVEIGIPAAPGASPSAMSAETAIPEAVRLHPDHAPRHKDRTQIMQENCLRKREALMVQDEFGKL